MYKHNNFPDTNHDNIKNCYLNLHHPPHPQAPPPTPPPPPTPLPAPNPHQPFLSPDD